MHDHGQVAGGDGGIRTLDTLMTYTPLAGERLQPLGHVSSPPTSCCMPANGAGFKWFGLENVHRPECFQSSLMIWPSRAALAPAKTWCAMASIASSWLSVRSGAWWNNSNCLTPAFWANSQPLRQVE